MRLARGAEVATMHATVGGLVKEFCDIGDIVEQEKMRVRPCC
jgi:hypothetical protein